MANFNQGLAWVLLASSIAAACSKEPENAAKAAPGVATVPASAPIIAPAEPPPPPPEPSPIEVLRSKGSLIDAIAYVKPMMSDTDEETSQGAMLLGVWALDHLRWADVVVARNETSFALVRKDADSSRGKRLCVGGSIIQIAKDKSGLFTGLLLNGYSQIVSFIVAGSTGELIEHSDARLCAVVIGTYDYSNSGGGKGHAVSVVGMFDLPENRQVRLAR